MRRGHDPFRALLLAAALGLAAGAGPVQATPEEAAAEAAAVEFEELPPPKLGGVLPFSSCNPNGSLVVEGENLGRAAGTLRLVGHFPGQQPPAYLDLVGVEWTEKSVSGRVPGVTGALDQEVRIQVRRPDGAVSNGIPCQFTADRVAGYLEYGRDLSHFCSWGEGYDDAGFKSDLDWTLRRPTPRDRQSGALPVRNVGCRHHNNRHGGNRSGSDQVETRRLHNGWVIDEVLVSTTTPLRQPGQEGRLLGVDGWKKGATAAEFLVSWEIEESVEWQWLAAVRVVGPAGVPWWEPRTLAPPEEIEWTPIPSGPPGIRIVAPGFAPPVAPDATGFELEIVEEGTSPAADWVVELEWIRYGAGKDPSIEKWGPVPRAPNQVRWDQLPLTVPLADLDGEGRYGVRAKLARRSESHWTGYHDFLVGDGLAAVAAERLPALRPDALDPAAVSTLQQSAGPATGRPVHPGAAATVPGRPPSGAPPPSGLPPAGAAAAAREGFGATAPRPTIDPGAVPRPAPGPDPAQGVPAPPSVDPGVAREAPSPPGEKEPASLTPEGERRLQRTR